MQTYSYISSSPVTITINANKDLDKNKYAVNDEKLQSNLSKSIKDSMFYSAKKCCGNCCHHN